MNEKKKPSFRDKMFSLSLVYFNGTRRTAIFTSLLEPQLSYDILDNHSNY